MEPFSHKIVPGARSGFWEMLIFCQIWHQISFRKELFKPEGLLSNSEYTHCCLQCLHVSDCFCYCLWCSLAVVRGSFCCFQCPEYWNLHSAGGTSAEVEAELQLVSLFVFMLRSVSVWSLRDIFPDGHLCASSQFGLVVSLGLHCVFWLRSSPAISGPGLSVPKNQNMYFRLMIDTSTFQYPNLESLNKWMSEA